MEHKFLMSLYRDGSETASNTRYACFLGHILQSEEEQELHLEPIKMYHNLSVEQVNMMIREVERYLGRQDTLIQKIDDILKANKPA